MDEVKTRLATAYTRWPKNVSRQVYVVTSSKIFADTQQKICNKAMSEDSTTPKTRRYATL